jgi:DNA repair protein RadA/Sms
VGRCPACGEWNTLVEESVADRGTPVPAGGSVPVPIDQVGADQHAPRPTGVPELDRVLSGGFVPGSVTLVGGEPGIGKSTLLLQVAAGVAASGRQVLYVSAEESAHQIRLRAERLGALRPRLLVASETSLPRILAHLDELRPELVVVDSIQTVHDPDLSSAPGSVAQVRECAARLVAVAKARDLSTVLVGHVTKEGSLAGPRVLEHLVDTVLSFEGDRHHGLRMLRATKHRFGATAELGVLEMGEGGLAAVGDPSELFLADRRRGVAGSVVVPALDGHRPLLVEVQALVAPSAAPSPRRSAEGLDAGRLAMLLAVLTQRVGISVSGADVYTLAVGGARVADTGADAGLALAVASAVTDQPVPDDLVVVGEVGLGGELRQVGHLEQRLREAERLGFRRAIVPATAIGVPDGLEALPVASLADAVAAAGLTDVPAPHPADRRGGRHTSGAVWDEPWPDDGDLFG